jgi:predicted ATPase
MHLKQVCIFPQKFPIHDRYPFNLHIFSHPRTVDVHCPVTFFASEIFKNFAQIVDKWARMDPGLLEYFGAKIYSFGRSSLEQIGYEETEHFQVYKSFMQDPNKYLQDL